jgi:prolipoprotein diacylglyceryl transferase
VDPVLLMSYRVINQNGHATPPASVPAVFAPNLVPGASPVVASIPSPSNGQLHVGPLVMNAYGLCIALGVVAGVWLASKRWVAMGGSADTIGRVATWAVPGGVIGARIYHVITDWKSFRGRWGQVFFIWKGGLGIWGGVFLGVVVAWIVAKRLRVPMGPLFHAAAPAIPLAQGIGRWGNWFNIELFGRPSTLPWALEVPLRKRPEGFKNFTTFHPTFLYESLWNVGTAIVVVLLSAWLLKRFRTGAAFALYVILYTFARFFIERIRIDEASKIAGLRVNEWVSGIVFIGALITLLMLRKKAGESTESTDDLGQVTANPAQ